MIRKPPPGKNRLIEFRSWAREISEKARWDKRWKGTAPDVNGQMARAMERAYQQGYEDAQTGRHSFSNEVSSDPEELVPVPSAQMSDKVLGVLRRIGMFQIGQRGQPITVDGRIRAFFHQDKHISDYRRKAPDWQLCLIREGRDVETFGDPVSDRTVQLVVKAGLLERKEGPNPDENFLVLSVKGHATYLETYINR